MEYRMRILDMSVIEIYEAKGVVWPMKMKNKIVNNHTGAIFLVFPLCYN